MPDAQVNARLERFLEMLERTPFDEIRLFAVRSLDPAAHETARQRALLAAEDAGRDGLRVDVAQAISDFLTHSYGSHAYDPTMIGLAWRHEPLRPQDRARLLDTLIDASLAILTQDLIDEAIFDELLGPCSRLAGTGGE